MSETESATGPDGGSHPQTPESPVREGDILAGKYRVEKVLGVGGMGVVVAAMHTELEERVALKFLIPSAAQNPAVVARFSREARAAAKIKSQHVARVIDVGTLETGTPYIVMEYLEGKDLADILVRDGRMLPGLAIDYVLQASEALAEAHAAGFVHRDLKPPNLFLADQSDGGSIIKVLDFGISKAVIVDEPQSRSLTATSDVFGSPLYMSPEQLKSSRDVDARADVWALGVILYELISGRAPFDRPTVAETFGAILYEQPVPLRKLLPEIPEELDRVILRCLEKDKTARVGNVAELVKALLPYASSSTARTSFDRTSRVLRRAGVTVDSMPPPSFSSGAQVTAQTSLGPLSVGVGGSSGGAGAQTRTAWDTAGQIPPAQRQRAGSRTSLVIGLVAGVVLAAGAGLLLTLRQSPGPPATVSVTADRGTAPATALPIPAVAVAETSLPAVVTPAPTAAPTAAPAPATSVTAAGAVPTVSVGGAFPSRGKGGRGVKAGPAASSPGVTASPVSPPSPPSAPVAKPSKPEVDDYGDRK